MNEFSKIRSDGATRSRSVDFSDLYYPPQSPKPIITTRETTLNSQSQNTIQTNNTNSLGWCSEQEHEDDVGEIFGVILSKSCSGTSAASQRFWTQTQKTTQTQLQSTVKRVFSMRRSTSVSEGYCRIHDQFNPISSSIDEINQTMIQTRSKNKRSKILKACKRLFGLH
uniref:Uncharacterized protein n=1 Tax=Nelumbo nucifera TaxID=4432 RepID=A0A822Y0W7_NELNU|nr:TPA_asm: hypothetical protein HUJ06_026383 [Nelumbo nucifera]